MGVWAERLLHRSVFCISILTTAVTGACTSNDSSPEEPVEPGESLMGPGEEAAAPDDAGWSPEKEFSGELTDDPAAPHSGSDYGDMDTQQQNSGASPQVDNEENLYEQAFKEESEPVLWSGNDASIEEDINDPAATSSTPAPGAVVRYVDALLLNVRLAPSYKSKIVRRLRGGTKIYVQVINSRFAKIKHGEYVSRKFLSTTPTQKVSQKEVEKAWQKSKYKDTWKPPQ